MLNCFFYLTIVIFLFFVCTCLYMHIPPPCSHTYTYYAHAHIGVIVHEMPEAGGGKPKTSARPKKNAKESGGKSCKKTHLGVVIHKMPEAEKKSENVLEGHAVRVGPC